MFDYQVGTTVRLPLRFTRGLDPLIPDVGSVTYSLYDHTGNALITDEELTTTATTFQTTVEIAAEHNTIAANRRFERRRLVASYTVNGAAEQTVVVYRVIPVMNHMVTPHQIRNFIGLTSVELPDEDIDLAVAYFKIEDLIGAETLETNLVSGTISEISANTAICMQAVLDVIPSLKQRIAEQEKNGTKQFTRGKITDFEQLRQDAEAQLAAALDSLTTGISTEQALIVVTQDIDPITGA